VAQAVQFVASVRRRFREHPVESLLGLFGEVRPGELPTVLLLTANIFLILTAYYLVKVAREPLILVGGGAEVKSYSAAGQSILLVLVASAYGWLAARVSRLTLIALVNGFFGMNLVLFWLFGRSGVPLGVPFFLWAGIFNLVTVAQFWSFAADTYDDEQGKRLFPIIGIGSSLGAVSGALIAEPLVRTRSPYTLLLVAAGILLATLAITALVHARESSGARSPHAASTLDARRGEPVSASRGNAFALVARDRFLLLLAGLIFTLNIITKTGDYVLDRMVLVRAQAQHALTAQAYIGTFKARYFAWINVLEVIVQSLFVSRIIKHLGLRAALVVVPLISFAGYATAFLVPVLGTLLATRVAESTLDYSLSNTVRNALWLVTSREKKYKAKQVVDGFVWRAGDVVSAGFVWLGVRLGASASVFVAANMLWALVWLVLAVYAGHAWRVRSRAAGDERVALPTPRPAPATSG
jgi:AAA family ATP:ADP antiporter